MVDELENLKLRNRVLMGILGIGDDRSFRAHLCGALNVGLRSKKTLDELLAQYDQITRDRNERKARTRRCLRG